jgi:ornithine cyclodeaminase/alanine dehydrogenase-like protein (mu-crystallin family)
MSGITIIRSREIARHLPISACIEAMAQAFRAHAAGDSVQPLRTVVPVPGTDAALYVMPAHLGGAKGGTLAVKLVSLVPGNAARGMDTHQGAILLIDDRTGLPVALMEAGSVTAIRTAAVSGLATRHLARADASDLAVLGAGVQARSHVAAMIEVRPIARVRLWSRTPARARDLARDLTETHDVRIEVVADAEAAVRGAHIVCTVTSSPEPVVKGEWVAPGTHINAVGASTSTTRELDAATIGRARIYVDSRESAMAESGDILIAMQELGLSDPIRGTLGELVTGAAEGRTGGDDVTLFKSLGLALEDAAAAQLIYDRALEAGLPAVPFD